METENIAILVLIAGYAPLALAIRALWTSVIAANEREAAALREGIEIDRTFTAQIESMSDVVGSIQRTQRIAARAAHTGFQRLEALLEEAVSKIIQETRGSA